MSGLGMLMPETIQTRTYISSLTDQPAAVERHQCLSLERTGCQLWMLNDETSDPCLSNLLQFHDCVGPARMERYIEYNRAKDSKNNLSAL